MLGYVATSSNIKRNSRKIIRFTNILNLSGPNLSISRQSKHMKTWPDIFSRLKLQLIRSMQWISARINLNRGPRRYTIFIVTTYRIIQGNSGCSMNLRITRSRLWKLYTNSREKPKLISRLWSSTPQPSAGSMSKISVWLCLLELNKYCTVYVLITTTGWSKCGFVGQTVSSVKGSWRRLQPSYVWQSSRLTVILLSRPVWKFKRWGNTVFYAWPV